MLYTYDERRNWAHFASPADLAEWASGDGLASVKAMAKEMEMNESAAVSAMRDGDASAGDIAAKLIDSMGLRVALRAAEPVMGVAGFAPDIGEYMAGSPECMWGIDSDARSDVAPVRVIVDTTVSAEVSADDIAQRGAVLLAAVMAISASRPVDLTVGFFGDAEHKRRPISCVTVQMDTRAVDMSVIAAALTRADFLRVLMFGAGTQLCGFHENWPDLDGDTNSDTASTPRYGTGIKRHIGAGPEDLYIGPAYFKSEAAANPKKWLRDTLNAFEIAHA